MTPEQLEALAKQCGATLYSPPPMRAVRGWSFTHEQLAAFADALAAQPEGSPGWWLKHVSADDIVEFLRDDAGMRGIVMGELMEGRQPTVEPKGPPSEGVAHFHYRLDAASGYEQTGVYQDITAEKFGNLIGVLEGKLTVADAAQSAPAAVEQAPAPVSAFAVPDDVTLLKAYSRAAHGRHLAPQDRATFLRYARIGIAADRARTSGSSKVGSAA
ncbi:hypothetical protein ABIC63_002083 [Pseudacidovorax sp. 1753]|uniref:hypothetical protein n=1 Tax=Pseudacidovorax sp. 1753 TaxID=3156419 RepID=UPI00339B3E3C